jgi:hypothetical protein
MSKNGPIAKITGSIMGNGSANVMGDHLPETDAQAKLILLNYGKLFVKIETQINSAYGVHFSTTRL